MKIVLEDGFREFAQGRFGGHDVGYYSRDINAPGEFIEQIRDADVLGLRRAFSFPFDHEVVANLPRVQFIHKTGSGIDWFDMDALGSNGVLVATNRGLNSFLVAEHAVTLILLSLRSPLWHIQNMRDGNWIQQAPPGGDLAVRGKTIGIMGLGESGSWVARTMLAMGARVLAWQRHQPPGTEVLSQIQWASLDQLLRESDVVTLHIPLVPETRCLIGRREIGLMKPNSVLVNCARGGIVDEQALIDALKSGRLRAAGLDVFENEPLEPTSPLRTLPNVFATPHVAGFSAEMAEAQDVGALENIQAFLGGQVPSRLSNPEVLDSRALRARHLRPHEHSTAQ